MNTYVKRLSILVAGILLGGAGVVAHAGGLVDISFDASHFGQNSPVIDNQYWPLDAGKTYVYRSIGKKGDCQVNPVEIAGTENIDGVNTRVIHDNVFEDYDCTGSRDFLSEETTDWYAQDVYGNMWYFGEATQTHCQTQGNVHYDPNCEESTTGSWKAGDNDAKPGIVMLADPPPSPGDYYRQEYADEAHDMAKVLRLNADVSLIFDNTLEKNDYTGCLITKEWSPLEHGAIENKYYCPGTGLVLINEFQSGTVRTELVDVQ